MEQDGYGGVAEVRPNPPAWGSIGSISEPARWAQAPGARTTVGDFNADGKADITLLPGANTSWWFTIPVAHAVGDATFRITSTPSSDFAGWAQQPGARLVATLGR